MTQQRDPAEIGRVFDAEIAERDERELAELGPRYNVAPTQPVIVVVEREGGRTVEAHRWGLVPAWSASPAQAGARYINARAETIAASPAFRASFVRRRCLIPVDGFYEWLRVGRRRQPFLIRPARGNDHAPLAFAGIWAPWRDPASGEWLLSAAVVTTVANGVVGRLHDRMPAVLRRDDWSRWLDPTIRDTGTLGAMLKPADEGLLELLPVSPLVNSVSNEGPELIVPLSGEVALPERALTLFG